MSDTTGSGAATPKPAQPTNAAQDAFGKYKSRLAAAPAFMPHAGWHGGAHGAPPWGMPPSFAAMPGAAASPHPMGSLTERLGATVRLGVDLLNAALASGASALGGVASFEQRMWGAESHHHGCDCCGCGEDCCETMGCDCCRPGVHGCGCCRCC